MSAQVPAAVAAGSAGRGAAASLTCSALFAAIFLIAGLLHGWGPEEVFGWRVVLTLPTLLLVLPWFRWGRAELARVLHRIRTKPALVPVGLLAAALVGVQLWLFMWAPLHGMALSVSFGYFLLPLAMVLVGRFLFGEKLGLWRTLAVAAAALGVLHQTLSAGGLAWPTLVVCLGYPVYFVLRAKIGFDTLGAFAAELLALLPLGLYFILAGPHGVHGTAGPGGYVAVWSIGVLGAFAMILYLLASRLMPLSLFGLLGYVEPVLLVAVAVALGEALEPSALLTYLPIAGALVLLAVDGFVQARR
ncbi:EamA family transporter RarD [Specibacter cremeus]|uniref:EamA family transporter RarD n=1 Tax=Specibacter cremeus TaxID=1629051 RepID=UPI000F79EDC1|nr:EamA family transporter RarD [Specibacter cremeus]